MPAYVGAAMVAGSVISSGKNASSAKSAQDQSQQQFEQSMDYKMWTDKQNAQYAKEQGAYNAAALQANAANDWAMKAANLNTNWASKQVDTAALYGAPGQKFSVAKPELPAQQAMPNYNDFVTAKNEVYKPNPTSIDKRNANAAALTTPGSNTDTSMSQGGG